MTCPECSERQVVPGGYLCYDCWERLSIRREIKSGEAEPGVRLKYKRLREAAALKTS